MPERHKSALIDLLRKRSGMEINMEEKKERLNKYLASCGICSRREADRLIAEGRVTVDGQTASAGMQVCGREKVMVNR